MEFLLQVMEHLVALVLLSLVVGVFGDCEDVCKHNNTCCRTSEGWKCCPFADAVCCANEKHCCPRGTVCDRLGGCYYKMKPLLAHIIMKREGTIPQNRRRSRRRRINRCDGDLHCPRNSTCCQSEFFKFGCCPFPNGKCCSDKIQCCPPFSECARDECIVKYPKSPIWYGIPPLLLREPYPNYD
ncbi:granulin [Nephila pilipes]|uniref:Granulin n=1 Tax=Nephila pilipes TaxID=299642 RepID=A0A8X6QVR3_NEPPI|nr:granulin [Nephila pilipes]